MSCLLTIRNLIRFGVLEIVDPFLRVQDSKETFAAYGKSNPSVFKIRGELELIQQILMLD